MKKEKVKFYGLLLSGLALFLTFSSGVIAWGSNLQKTDTHLAGRIDGVQTEIKHVEIDMHARCNALNEKVDANQTHINEKLDLIVTHVVPHPR